MIESLPLASLTYLQFHLLFLLPPLVVLLAVAVPFDRPRAEPVGLLVLVGLAVLYTTPWDNHLIAVGVWDYPPAATLAHIWHAPVEEYAFFVVQPLLTGLWLCVLDTESDYSLGVPTWTRALGVLAGVGVGVLGWLSFPEAYYLGALLLWAAPILAVQWGFALPVLWSLRRTWLLGVAVPTLYLATADRVAIDLGIWVFDQQYLSDLAVLGLPLEEGLFFTLTNAFVVQGLLLFWWVTDRWPQVTDRYSALELSR